MLEHESRYSTLQGLFVFECLLEMTGLQLELTGTATDFSSVALVAHSWLGTATHWKCQFLIWTVVATTCMMCYSWRTQMCYSWRTQTEPRVSFLYGRVATACMICYSWKTQTELRAPCSSGQWVQISQIELNFDLIKLSLNLELELKILSSNLKNEKKNSYFIFKK